MADIRVEDGAVSVVVPIHIPVEKIDQLLAAKCRWIKEKIALQREMTPVSGKQYVSGEAFAYLGCNYRLEGGTGQLHPRTAITRAFAGDRTPGQRTQPQMIRNALVRWYKGQAEQKLQEKVIRLAPAVGVQPAGTGIKTFKSRWGSCSAKERSTSTGKLSWPPTAWWIMWWSMNCAT